VDQAWKDQFIQTYIAASSPTVGAAQALQALTSGYDFSIPFLLPSLAKVVQRTFPSNYFLLPYPKFYGPNKIFAYTPQKNYTAYDYLDLFDDLGLGNMYGPYVEMFNLANPYQAPGINTYCFYGYNVSTVTGEIFKTNDFTRPISITGDGDGTVPIESLTFCQNWAIQNDKSFSMKGFEGQDHVGLLIYEPFIIEVIRAIFNHP
jgi:hypothetical protein